MLTEKRQEEIVRLVYERESITVAELKEILHSSESTIRRDIIALDQEGRLTKVFGGAIALRTAQIVNKELSFTSVLRIGLVVKDLDEPLRDKNVIVVEDIVDSGRTLSYLLDMLKARGPKSMALCTLLDKPDRRVIVVKVDYTGFQIPDEFVVGYGLDYDQRYRNLPYIGVVKFD